MWCAIVYFFIGKIVALELSFHILDDYPSPPSLPFVKSLIIYWRALRDCTFMDFLTAVFFSKKQKKQV